MNVVSCCLSCLQRLSIPLFLIEDNWDNKGQHFHSAHSPLFVNHLIIAINGGTGT